MLESGESLDTQLVKIYPVCSCDQDLVIVGKSGGLYLALAEGVGMGSGFVCLFVCLLVRVARVE